ncbi:hypothetical protein N7532_009700 [Penicillium argentinense]|uniref:Integrase catalytic domain-containing protein n=1 Tax=Penicillium argentinense TaxID=1131581 RepID=A0A9W9EZY8_9EURO|nr:uncharacterized protein N7532_009700 [Penicillium argentinense]KAJ5091016.1 hypothetical protein N7532_009700 [Penicillium argentinense]
MEMPIGKEGSRHVITFTDDFSRGSWAYVMRWKHEALQMFRQFEAWVHRQFGARIRKFLTDNGREYLPIGTHLESQGVEFDTSPPYCKGQNGLAERTNRTIRERINTLLYDAKLPPSWWTDLLETVVYLKLRAPASILQKKTPYEVIYGKPPKLLHLRLIGSRAWTKSNGIRKARLVIKGYRQKHGIDYHETFAAVSRMDSVRSIVASAVLRGWKLHQFDAVIAFLHGDIDSSIYMEFPEGFEEDGYVCRLRRSLYGLKQAPRIWYQCVHRILVAHGFTMAQSDNCVFFKPKCVVCVYVDDFLVAAADDAEIQQLRMALESDFKLNDLGTPRSFLGIQFDFHADGSISIHQHRYIQKVLSDFCMETCQPKSTPIAPKALLNYLPEENDLDEDAKARFGTAIGSLMYLMVGTRPDIAFALGALSRFTSRPQSHHQAALQRLLRYVRATKFYRITYRNGQLIGYTDADFGGSVVIDGEIATSTTHAEYIGQYNAILHLEWLRTFLAETHLFRSPATNVMADNQSAIALSRNPEFHKRTKHFNVKFHYQRAVLNKGEICLEYIPTEEQAADGLTKPLGPSTFTKFCNLLGIDTEGLMKVDV